MSALRYSDTASGPDGTTLPKVQAESVWAYWRTLVSLALTRGEGVSIERDGIDVVLRTVYAPQWEMAVLRIGPLGEVTSDGEQSAPEVLPDLAPMPWGQREVPSWDAVIGALASIGYEPRESSPPGSLILRIADAGDDDPEAAAALAEIQGAVRPLGWVADWTGDGDTWGDGSSTSDVMVQPATCQC